MKGIWAKSFCLAMGVAIVLGVAGLAEAKPKKVSTETQQMQTQKKSLKECCRDWEKRWLRMPHRTHTDSSPFQTSSARSVK